MGRRGNVTGMRSCRLIQETPCNGNPVLPSYANPNMCRPTQGWGRHCDSAGVCGSQSQSPPSTVPPRNPCLFYVSCCVPRTRSGRPGQVASSLDMAGGTGLSGNRAGTPAPAPERRLAPAFSGVLPRRPRRFSRETEDFLHHLWTLEAAAAAFSSILLGLIS